MNIKQTRGVSFIIVVIIAISSFSAIATNAHALQPDIQLIKEVYDDGTWTDSTIVNIEEHIEFRLTLINTGTAYLTNVHLVDDLPSFLTYNYDASGPLSLESDHHIEWIGDLPIGTTAYVTFSAYVNAAGEDNNSASVSSSEGATDSDTAYVIVEGAGSEGFLEVSKKVWNGTDWDNVVITDRDETVRFNISITYHMSDHPLAQYAQDILVVDSLPDCLEYADNVTILADVDVSEVPEEVSEDNHTIWWNFTSTDVEDWLEDGENIFIEFDATVMSFTEAEGENNVVDVTASESASGFFIDISDEATVIAEQKPPHIDVEKKVWNGTAWTDNLDGGIHLDDIVRFRIKIIYDDGGTDEAIRSMIVKDQLQDESLEYVGNVVYDTTGIADIPNFDLRDYNKTMYWNWTVDKNLFLLDEDSLTIEFDVKVIKYSQVIVCNIVEVTAWGSSGPGSAIYGLDDACVDTTIPDNIFEKKVWNESAGEWVDELSVFIGDTARFKIELTYYGNENLSDIKLIDLLPGFLEYANNANIAASNISDDKKTVWWNLTSTLNDSETLVLEFDALVTADDTGDNFVKVSAKEGDAIEPNFFAVDTANITASINYPPDSPDVTGDASGFIGMDLTFRAITSDPEGHQISYKFSWGDGSESSWLGPVNSGQEITETHSWSLSGSYQVKAKAKDSYGEESDWTAYPWTVEIYEPKLEITSIGKLINFGKIPVTINNTGNVAIDNIDVKINVTGGILNLINIEETGNIPTLDINQEGIVETTERIFGLGGITITVEATAPYVPTETRTANGFVLLSIIIILS